MSVSPPRATLDTVVFVQYLLSTRGAAAGCVKELFAGRFVALISDQTVAELYDFPLRPAFIAKYPFVTPAKVERLISEIKSRAILIPAPPPTLALPRDPKDQPFIDLAVAGNAAYLVTWNHRHLTYLMQPDTPEGADFHARYPNLQIVSPPEFLTAIRSDPTR